jgi:uncharacterized membrane protein YfcA
MPPIIEILTLVGTGLFAGILAGFLGIGGGTIVVPLLIAMQCTPVQAIATSSLSIVITSISGSWQNWRMGYLRWEQVFPIAIPALFTAQIGVYLARLLPPKILLISFGFLLLVNIYLVELRRRLTVQNSPHRRQKIKRIIARIITGSAGGLFAGLFGVGGGIVMVPLQLLLLGEPIKLAIQTSLGVVVIASISASIGHTLAHNILWYHGLILGFGGLFGAQVSTRFLPKLSDDIVALMFRSLLIILAIYIFYQAFQK